MCVNKTALCLSAKPQLHYIIVQDVNVHSLILPSPLCAYVVHAFVWFVAIFFLSMLAEKQNVLMEVIPESDTKKGNSIFLLRSW